MYRFDEAKEYFYEIEYSYSALGMYKKPYSKARLEDYRLLAF